MAQTVADFVLHRLRRWGVERVFGYPGDGINGFQGALDRRHPDAVTGRSPGVSTQPPRTRLPAMQTHPRPVGDAVSVVAYGYASDVDRQEETSRVDPAFDEEPSLDESLAQGRRARTPFVLIGIVAGTLWSVAALVCLTIFLVWWLT